MSVMPQPIRKKCDVVLIGLVNRPEHAASLGRIVAISGILESLLGHLLAFLTGTSSSVAMAMFHSVTSTDAQRAMLAAAAEQALAGAQLEEFRDLMGEFRTRYGERSRLVHNVWGESPQHPDKAIWCPAKDATKIMANLAATTAPEQIDLLANSEAGSLWIYCSTYTAKEINDVFDRLAVYANRVGSFLVTLQADHPVIGPVMRQGAQPNVDPTIGPPPETVPDQNPE